MKFLRRILGRDEYPPPTAPSAAHEDLVDAQAEMVVARHELRKSRGEREDAEQVAKRLRKENAENHFAGLLKMALRGVIE